MHALPSHDSISARLKIIGPALEPQAMGLTLETFAHLHKEPPPSSVVIERDQSYGVDERQKLDLFYPKMAANPRPVMLFIPGGGFTGGDRTLNDGPVHSNIGIWAAQQGWIGAVMSHRLAPENPWPAGAQDVAAALDWLKSRTVSLGGDPSRMILVGHSAGAAHAAAYLTHAEFYARNGPGVAGAVLISGLYNMARFKPEMPIVSYYGGDATLYPERSGLPTEATPKLPLMLAIAEDELPMFHEQARDMSAAVFDHWGYLPPLLQLMGHGHFSEIFGFNTGYRPELEHAIKTFADQVISGVLVKVPG